MYEIHINGYEKRRVNKTKRIFSANLNRICVAKDTNGNKLINSWKILCRFVDLPYGVLYRISKFIQFLLIIYDIMIRLSTKKVDSGFNGLSGNEIKP